MSLSTIVNIGTIGSLLFGVIAFIALNIVTDSKDKSTGKTMICVIFLLLCICGFFGFPLFGTNTTQNLPMQKTEQTTFKDIWTATCPFGIISYESHGYCYFSSGSYAEIYSLKFIEGNEIKTMSFNADSVKLIFDGTFKLETTKYRYYKIDPFDGSKIPCDSHGYQTYDYDEDDWMGTNYVIHIPQLPTPDMTTTTWYVGG
jgi:hypothetical protein